MSQRPPLSGEQAFLPGLYLGLVDDALLLFSAEKRETGQEDWEEISSFLPLSGARKILCPAFCGERLRFSTELQGRILRKKSAVLVKEAAEDLLTISGKGLLPEWAGLYRKTMECIRKMQKAVNTGRRN